MQYIEIMQYIEYYSIDKLNEKLKANEEIIKRFAYCLHDQEKEDRVHFHCMIEFYSKGWDFERISNKFDIPTQYLEKPKSKKNPYYHMCLYLIHRNDFNKYQYNENDVKTNFNYSQYVNDQTAMKNDDFISDLIDWQMNIISFKDMCIKYGRDFIKNLDKYRLAAQELANDLIENQEIF